MAPTSDPDSALSSIYAPSGSREVCPSAVDSYRRDLEQFALFLNERGTGLEEAAAGTSANFSRRSMACIHPGPEDSGHRSFYRERFLAGLAPTDPRGTLPATIGVRSAAYLVIEQVARLLAARSHAGGSPRPRSFGDPLRAGLRASRCLPFGCRTSTSM